MRGPVGKIAVVMVLALAWLVVPGLAQEDETTDPTPEANVLYASYNTDEEQWAIQTNMESSSTQEGTSDPGVDGSYTWTLPLRPDLQNDLRLDLDAEIQFHIVVGNTLSAGDVAISTRLLTGETEIAAAASEGSQQFANEFKVFDLAATPSLDTIMAADGLTWEITASGDWVFMALQMDTTGDWTTLTLPIAANPDAGTTETVQLDGLDVDLDFGFDNATSETRSYNWNTTRTNGTIAYTATGNGSFEIEILDGAGDLLAGSAAAASGGGGMDGNGTGGDGNGTGGDGATTFGEESIDFTDAAPGNWSIVITFEEFTGSFSLDITDMEPEEPEDGGAGDGDDDGGDGMVIDDEEENEESPALGILALLALLGGVLVLRRKS